MGHKTDQGRYSHAGTEQPKQISPRRAKSIATRCVKQLEAGRRAYAKAGELLDQLVAGGLVGKEIKLGDGRPFAVVDQFATRNTVFKSTPIARYKLEELKG